MSIQKRRVISLFEAGNASLAREELPRIFPRQLKGDLRTSDETAAYAFALQHHPSLESVILSCPVTGSVNLQLLLDALFHHPTTRDLYIETFKDSTMDGSVHGSLAEGECVKKAHPWDMRKVSVCAECVYHLDDV